MPWGSTASGPTRGTKSRPSFLQRYQIVVWVRNSMNICRYIRNEQLTWPLSHVRSDRKMNQWIEWEYIIYIYLCVFIWASIGSSLNVFDAHLINCQAGSEGVVWCANIFHSIWSISAMPTRAGGVGGGSRRRSGSIINHEGFPKIKTTWKAVGKFNSLWSEVKSIVERFD